MEPMELLEKVKSKDEDAFYVLVHKYGRSIYTRLLSRLGDKTLADEAFRKTIVSFYDLICRDDSSDPVEAILMDSADKVQQEILSESVENAIAKTAESFTDFYNAKSLPAVEDRDVHSAVNRSSAVIDPPAVPLQSVGSEASEQIKKPRTRKKGISKAWFIVCIVIVALAMFALTWVIVGELMSCGRIPYRNIGYESFIGAVQRWFAGSKP